MCCPGAVAPPTPNYGTPSTAVAVPIPNYGIPLHGCGCPRPQLKDPLHGWSFRSVGWTLIPFW